MELQMAPQAAKPIGRSTPPHHHGGGARPVPAYLRPAAGSCHHVCKYGGTHEFEEKEPTKTKKKPHPKPRKQQPAQAESQSKVMVKVRSVFRRRVGDSSKADNGKAKGAGESVEWKDIVAYDTTSPHPHNKISAPVTGSGDAKKKVVTKGNNNLHEDKATIAGQADVLERETQDETLDTKANTDDVIKSAIKPPKGGKKKKKPTSLLVEEMAMDHQELLQGYQVLSPSLMQSRACLLRDLEEEMVVHGGTAADAEEEKAKPACSLNEEEYAVVAAETIRPIPAHRRVKSVSIGSRSVRYTITRQASKNNAGGVAFKLRSRSTRAPEEEEKPAMARVRSRRGGEDASSGSNGGRGIQLRIRSLRRRGLGGGGSSGGFVVPAVALRHQKTLEKKKSQRLYNNVIEETASKLVKTRKSRVKALVGAFESVISKIAK